MAQFIEDSDWETVYAKDVFGDVCGEHPHLSPYKTFQYYQTYGGGPEGGYLSAPNGDVYKVERHWWQPFDNPEIVEGMRLEAREWECRLVPKVPKVPETKKCCLCLKEIEGFGHNPFPLCDVDDYKSRVCDGCNHYVVCARLECMNRNFNSPEEAREAMRCYENGVRCMLSREDEEYEEDEEEED